MSSRLNALNFVEDVFNNKVHPELKEMTVDLGKLFLRSSIPKFRDSEHATEDIDEFNARRESFLQENEIFRRRGDLCIQGTPINDEGVGIVEEGPEGASRDSLRDQYWVGIRASNRDTLTTFHGPKIRTTAITIVMGVGVNLYQTSTDDRNIDEKDRLGVKIGDDSPTSLVLRKNVERRIAFDILEFLERRSMVHFRRARRLRNEISMSDEFRIPVAYRRFTVIINA